MRDFFSKQKVKNYMYLAHALVVWAGGTNQIIYVFTEKSAQDITIFWIACLLFSEFLALPRAIDSPYIVWKLCHVISSILIATLLAGVIIYGG